MSLSRGRGNDDLSLLYAMMLIREFEITSLKLSAKAKIPGGMHSAAGQEAVAVGAVAALGENDLLASTHRSHHHALAMGLSPNAVMAELYGKVGDAAGAGEGICTLPTSTLGFSARMASLAAG